jgi:hypothetical protein
MVLIFFDEGKLSPDDMVGEFLPCSSNPFQQKRKVLL